MKLTKRLDRISSFVENGAIIADVGTDHGYIPIKLALDGKIEKAYAMDVNKEPLQKAKLNIDKNGVATKVHTILSDGLENLNDHTVNTIVIAGMGGMLIVRILKDASDFLSKGKRLILSPHGDSKYVRREIHQQSYRIIEEDFIKEDGKYYPIIICEKGKEEMYTKLDYRYGKRLIESKNKVLRQFLNEELVRLNKVHLHLIKQLEVDNTNSKETLVIRNSQIENEINNIKEVITCL